MDNKNNYFRLAQKYSQVTVREYYLLGKCFFLCKAVGTDNVNYEERTIRKGSASEKISELNFMLLCLLSLQIHLDPVSWNITAHDML